MDKERNLGLAAMAAGAVLVAVKHVVFPYDDAYNAILNGGGAGLAVAGVSAFRKSAWAGQRPGLKLLALAYVPLLFALSMGALWLRLKGVDPDVELVPRSVMGYRLSLPEWEVKEQPRHAVADALRVEAPTGKGRFIELRWSAATEDLVDIAETVYAQPPLSATVRERVPATVSGMQRSIALLEGQGGKRMALTTWRCPRDNRNAYLTTFLSMSAQDLVTLHRRVVESVQCEEPPAGTGPVFPAIPEMKGFSRSDGTDDSVIVLMGDDAAVSLALAPGIPGRKTFDEMSGPDLKKAESLVLTLLNTMGLFKDLKVQPRFAQEGRMFWKATGVDEDGVQVRLLMTLWYCPGIETTFMAFHTDATSNGKHQAAAVGQLLSVQCPKGGQ